MSYPFRGLTNFITDIRYCSSKEEEVNRVEKELAHIRETFVNPKKINIYERKKFCLKLMYMSILGYPIDFGHMEAMELIFSPKYQDKIIGYTVLSVFINERSEILRLVNQSLLSDLGNRRIPFQTISLSFIANCGNGETAENLANNVAKILMNPTSTTYLLKKASLCLLHLYRKNKEVVQPGNYVDKIRELLKHTDGGVLTAVLSLLLGLAQTDPSLFEDIVPAVCTLLNKVVLTKYVQGDYMYDHIPAPWLIVKAFQFLQYYNTLPNESTVKDLELVLKRIINTDSKNFAAINQSNRHLKRHNAMLAVLIEAINVVVKLHMEASLVQRSIQHIRYFMSIGDPDMRYLSLEAAQVLCPLDPTTTGDDKEFVAIVEKTLRHPDISLRRRALDVLFEMCSEKNSNVIVNKLVEYLDIAEFELKEELVLKIAILAEKYPVDNKWYLDIIFRLIQTAGEASPQEIWFRTVQIISTQPAMQEYAAQLSLKVIRNTSIPENAVRISSYLLGEYHAKLPTQDDEGALEEAVFKMQHHYKRSTNPTTQAIVVSGLSKIVSSPLVTAEIKDGIQDFIKSQVTNVSEDTQERAVEAVALINTGSAQAAAAFAPMPSFTVRQSILLKDLKKKVKQRGGVEKGSTHLEGVKDTEEEDEEAEEQKNKEALQSAKDAAQLAQGGVPQKAPPAARGPSSVASASSSVRGPAPAASGPSTVTSLSSTSLSGPLTTTQRPQLSPIENAFKALLTSNEGVIYEDPNLRVNFSIVESNNRPPNPVTFTFQLTYTSKVVGLIDNIKANINNVSGITFNSSPLNPNQLRSQGSSTKQQHSLQKEIESLYVDPPTITISYSFGLDTRSVSLKLPIVLHRWFNPITPPAEEYQKAWNSIPSSSPLESVHVFLAKGQPISPAGLNEIVKSLTTALKFQFLKGYDTTPNTLCFASSLKPNTSAKIIAIMLKLAPAAQGQISITVKSTDPSVTASIRKYVVELFV